jgi:hypothetical protein
MRHTQFIRFEEQGLKVKVSGAKVRQTIDSRRAGRTMLLSFNMNLDETQRKKVAAWIEEGLKLSDIQKRLETEFGLRVTYLDVRLLVDDLKLKPKDPAPPPKAPEPAGAESPLAPGPAGAPVGKVNVSVDQLARPGAMVSGKVTFSDGKSAEWILDQTGRLGLVPGEKGYKPPAADLQEFQIALQAELQKLGI